MKNSNPHYIKIITTRIALFVLLFLSVKFSYGQSGVGIGTSSPNPNAILDIVSTSNDKGILIPRMTTAQRIAMNASLSTNEKGLMVFDTDLNGFYFWNNTDWVPTTIIQDLQLIGNTLTITNNSSATDIDLAPFSGSNTDNQTLSLSGTNLAITGGNSLDLSPIQDGVNDADSNPTNELQNISTNGTAGNISLTSGGTLTLNVNDADASATNELQNLGSSAAGTNRTVTISGGTNATFSIADNDNSTTNEIQDLQLTGNILTITNNASPTNIDLSAFSGTNTDNQTLSLSGTNITITGGNTLDLAPLQDGVNDADSNPTNELQNISTNGTAGNISLTSGGTLTLNVNDADSDPNNEFQTISKVGSTVTLSNGGGSFTDAVNDADASATNELVTGVALSGTTLRITDAGGNNDVDLSSLTGTSTDDQVISLTGNTLAIEDGGSVNLAGYLDNTDSQNLGSSAAGTTRTVTITGGTNATFSIADNDNSTTNELITGVALSGTTLRITDAGGNNDVDLSSLTGTSTDDQAISLTGNTLAIEDGGSVNLAGYLDNTDNQNLGSSAAGTTRTVTITGGTNATFSIADNDNSTTNELITGAFLSGTTLRITDAGGNTNVNLAPLQDGTGTDNQTLSVSGSTLTIAGGNSVTLPSSSTTKEAFKAYLSSVTSIPSGSGAIDFDAVLYDINGTYGGGKYTPPVTGIYTFNGVFDVRMVEGTWFTIVITVDGAIKYRLRERTANLSGAYRGYAFSVDLRLNAGEVVQFELSSGSAQQLNGGSEDRTFVSGRLAVEL